VDILITILEIAVALFVLDRFGLWLERRGWLYYRHKKPGSGGAGNALQELNAFFVPSARHSLEIRQKEIVKENENGDPL
jgi:hypothetical protein